MARAGLEDLQWLDSDNEMMHDTHTVIRAFLCLNTDPL